MPYRRSVLLIVLTTILIGLFTATALADKELDRVRAHKIVATWHFAEKAEMKEAFAEHLDVLYFDYGRSIQFLTDETELRALQARGYDISVDIVDIYAHYRANLLPTDMGGYRTFDEIVLTMDTLTALNPAICSEKFSIGQTIEGREMWVMKISDNVTVDEDEPESFFDAAIHAREVITPAVVLETMRTLIEGYGVDPYLTDLVDNREVWFMPCFNADGYAYNEYIEPGGLGMWRKNRRDNGDGSFGVDLNRNFHYAWGYDDDGSSPIPDDPTYRGTGPASEPETQNYMTFVESRNFITHINIHSYSNLILWPYGYDYDLYSPDHDLYTYMGDSMATFNGYTPMVSWGLYPANGVTTDWMYGEQSTKDKIFSFTFEIGSYSDNFWPPTYRIPQLVAENIPCLLYLIDISANPYQVAPPLAPEWVMADTFPSGFFDLNWSQPADSNIVDHFILTELLGPNVGTDDAESGWDYWVDDGFERQTNRKYEGAYSYSSGEGDNLFNAMTTRYPLTVPANGELTFYTLYDIETDWDYAYVEVATSTAGPFSPIAGSITTTSDPNGNNRGHGITGSSGGWIPATFDLSGYAGEDIFLRFSYVTDGYVAGFGFFVDLINPVAWFDSETVLADDYADTTFPIYDQPTGDYYYTVQAIDTELQTGARSVLKQVTVDGSVVYGDLNGDGGVDPLDVVWLVNYVFKDANPPVIEGGQYIDGNSTCDPADVQYLASYVFKQTAAPIGWGE